MASIVQILDKDFCMSLLCVGNFFYVPETHIMYLTHCCWFLITNNVPLFKKLRDIIFFLWHQKKIISRSFLNSGTLIVSNSQGIKGKLSSDQYCLHTANEGLVRIQYKCLVPIYVFPEIKLLFLRENCNGLPVPTLKYLWEIYLFPGSVCLLCCRKIWGPILGIYCINRSHTHKCGNWDWGSAIPRKGIHKWDFRCCAVCVQYLWWWHNKKIAFFWPLVSYHLCRDTLGWMRLHRRGQLKVSLRFFMSLVKFTKG